MDKPSSRCPRRCRCPRERGPRGSEDDAPTADEERASLSSLELAPLVRRRIRQLRLEGRLVCGWRPPVISIRRCRWA
jgi:hypothetical protein